MLDGGWGGERGAAADSAKGEERRRGKGLEGLFPSYCRVGGCLRLFVRGEKGEVVKKFVVVVFVFLTL
jgi:hypothetical protein